MINETSKELLNRVAERSANAKSSDEMMSEWMEKNDVKIVKDSDVKSVSKSKSFTSGMITTASTGANTFWNEMARKRDLSYAKQAINNELTSKELIKNLGGE